MIGAGWGRTGTTSLAKALDRLGAGPWLSVAH
ncbi:sulfotransferase [Actinoplanes sp. NPDC024001]